MSQTTVLSYKYATRANFVRRVNKYLNIIQRGTAFRPTKPGEPITTSQEAKAQLALILVQLSHLFRQERVQNQYNSPVPIDVVRELKTAHEQESESYLHNLQTLVSILQENQELDEQGWKILNEIGNAADYAASSAFQKLWRR